MTNLDDIFLAPSDICTAYSTDTIGSKVINYGGFANVLRAAIAVHDFTKDRVPGQAVLDVPEAIPYCSSGVGNPVADPGAYVLRLYRGRVSAYLKRQYAAPVEHCKVVVYTRDAYEADPDVSTEELARISMAGIMLGRRATHVVVAVLASSGEPSQLSPHRFTANLAGGNREALVWTADEIRAKAREIMSYDQQWCTVAD